MTNEESGPKKPTEASVFARLEGLRSDRRRPQTALLAEHLDNIERSLARGIPRVVIWEALCEEGFTMTFKSFETFLHRLRKRKASSTAPQRPEASKPTIANLQALPPNTPPTSSKPNPGLTIPGYKSKLTDKDREEYQAFKESIKDLPDRERRKRLEQFMNRPR